MVVSIATVVLAIATVVLVVVAYAQLKKNRESQRAAFLSEYISKIFTDKKLSHAYHYLVYTYTDSKFCEVCKALNEKKIPEAQSDIIRICIPTWRICKMVAKKDRGYTIPKNSRVAKKKNDLIPCLDTSISSPIIIIEKFFP